MLERLDKVVDHLHVEHVEGGALREAREAEVDPCGRGKIGIV